MTKSSIQAQDLAQFEANVASQSQLAVSRRAVTNCGVVAAATDEEEENKLVPLFSLEVDAGDVTNQKQSGRCWMFAGLNVLRVALAKKLNVKTIELSQAYLQFYDKLEKANFLLEQALALSDEPLDSRLNIFLLDTALGDGGHFVMFRNLVKKYGVVPSSVMPDNGVNSATSQFNNLLHDLVSHDVVLLREAKKEGKDVEALKAKMLQDVYQVLAVAFGVPPKHFVYEYKDKDDKFVRLEETTPLEFYDQYIGIDLDDYVVLSNAPMAGYESYQKYATKYVNNVIEGNPVTFFNVSLPEMKQALIASLKGGEVVWFGADVLAQSLRKEGRLGANLLHFDELFGITTAKDKGERMDNRTSFCNHAMTFTGVNLLENDVPNRWKVENSWGKENGDNGYFVMDDAWFDNYVYEIFVRRKYVPADLLAKYDSSEIRWVDPFSVMWNEMD